MKKEYLDTDDLLFICYSIKLKREFDINNIKYAVSGFNLKSNKHFWVYIKTYEVKGILEEWSKNKKFYIEKMY